MDDTQPPSRPPPNVFDQLNQISHQITQSQRGRGRGTGRGSSRGRNQYYQPQQYHTPSIHSNYQAPPPSIDSYPPLGAQPGLAAITTSASANSIQQQPQVSQGYQPDMAPREYFDRSRGANRDRHPRSQQHHSSNPGRQYQPASNDEFRRPPAPHGRLYQQNNVPAPAINAGSSFADQQRSYRHQVMAQVDYLDRVQQEARNKYQLKREEQIEKEIFRKRLENFFQDILSKQYPILPPHGVRLQCYGSLNNGFGLAGCDMDLLLALPDNFSLVSAPSVDGSTSILPPSIAAIAAKESNTTSKTEGGVEPNKKEHLEIGWLLEGALLDSRLGARLLTNTRVPILKICESPSDELLRNLLSYRIDQAKSNVSSKATPAIASTLPPALDLTALQTALSQLEDQDSAAKVALPETPPNRPGASLEFDGDFGIKCDVNFSNSVAVHNTRLLREYCLIDPRVAQVGVFVKTWAKIRDINTPYYGTLSSYGYVLMVLHYLMNIAQPPVIPNLQYLARDQDAWKGKTDIDLFEGKYDIRFLTNKKKIDEYRKSAGINRESPGMLIRNMLWYYSNRDGFNWKNEVISLRTKGGILRKVEKGWTEAKWSEKSDKKNVRLRYLVAIEDPFETEHNVGRVVGHNGIVAIRDEFRRAWDILARLDTDNPATEDLMMPVEGRGDLLRRDQDHHREKIKQMRQAAESKERELKAAAAKENIPTQDIGTLSDNASSSFPLRPVSGNQSSRSKLTQSVGISQGKPRQFSRRVRKVKEESDSENDDDSNSNELGTVQNSDGKMSDESVDEDPEPFCSPEDISLARGLDVWGHPVAWDLSTQDGRWLQWRDNKIKQGTWHGAVRPDLVQLDRSCPYDPRRPRGLPPPEDIFPPFPLNKYEHIGKTSESLSYSVRKNFRSQRQPSASELYSVSRPEQSQRKSLDQEDRKVILPIKWNGYTTGGRWLRRRDAMIRSGTLVVSELDEWHARLHSEFPYDPTMLKSKLQAYNQELRKNWKFKPVDNNSGQTTMRSQVAVDEHEQLSQAKQLVSQVLMEMKDTTGTSSTASHSRSHFTLCPASTVESPKSGGVEIKRQPTADETAEDKGEGIDEEMPDPAKIRRMRLAHFAQLWALSSPDAREDVKTDQPNVTNLMKEAGIDLNRPHLAKKNSAMSTWVSANSETGSHSGQVSSRYQLEQSSKALTRAEAAAHADVRDPSGIKVAEVDEIKKVPSTLYPNTRNVDRPKEEDPHIIPIPRTFGFKFDTRQLRDLAVIKQGGNGCARAGQEFEIEEDYEWGGGGEMGYKSTSGLRQSSGMNYHDVYEYGRGDEDGLLNELPRLDD